jgi:hypothetical protein
MRSKERMLVDLLLTRSNDQVRALIHPDRGCPAVKLAGGPPSRNTIREVGAEAQLTRFAATPPKTLTDLEGSVVSDGKSTTVATAHHRHRISPSSTSPVKTEGMATSFLFSIFLSLQLMFHVDYFKKNSFLH